MQDPIKIIYKYNNNKRVTKYGIYIFVGKNINNDIENILNVIKNMSLIDTLLKLNEKQYKKMENEYGLFWYTKFFNTYHIAYCFEIIKKNNEYNKKIGEKYGNKWMQDHFDIYNLFDTKTRYEYGKIIENMYKRKKTYDDDIDINLVFQKDKSINLSISESASHKLTKNVDDIYPEKKKYISMGGNNVNMGEKNEDIYQKEYIIDPDVEEIYKGIDTLDSNVKETTKNIKKILLNDDELINIGTNNFNENDMNDVEPNLLKNIFNKTYITTQYIYKDDTIKNIKNKISCSIKNSIEFGKFNYLIPSRQYLWTEYLYNDVIKKLMLEFKWIYRNKLLLLDVEPNNLELYEKMADNLKILKTHVKVDKFSKIYDENNILYDCEKYMTNNEIYMIDIYNEFGIGYNPNKIIFDNILLTYISLYFPNIKNELNDIIDYLNNKKEKEETLIQKTMMTINNDLIIENMIMDQIELYKIKDKNKYEYLFTEKYIINTIINLNLQIETPINLYHIFTYFTLSEKYMMVQYKKQDGNNIINIYKPSTKEILENVIDSNNNEDFNDEINMEEKIDVNIIQHAKNGLNFKIKMQFEKITKIITINLRENGKIEYTIAWKENEEATFLKISKTYDMVIELLKKINKECRKIEYIIPQHDDFQFNFIYIMQNFKLPNDEIIDHNKLSELYGYFYPYVSLVRNPRKRGSNLNNNDEKGKFGTYLKYKRISKYDNEMRIVDRIIFIMKNYEYTNKKLIEQISREFNLSEQNAIDKIDYVNQKYKHIKKSRKILKKMEDITKQKLPGISIEIQGKLTDKYKMRIIGTKSVAQLDRILIFLNIVLYIYVEIYINKNSDKIEFKKKLEQIKNIAERRHKVDVIFNYKSEKNILKKMIAYDKKRLGYPPEEGQSSWIRSCQNSGKQIRHPKDYKSNETDIIIKNGFVFNEKTNVFEKKIKINHKIITLKVVKVYDLDKNGNPTNHFVYYTCDPKINGRYIHIGFLTKSKNPHNLPLPCCFIKDQQLSKNDNIRKYYENAISISIDKIQNIEYNTKNILYILQDTNKLSSGKLGILPPFLDYYFNGLMMRLKIINQNILISAENGYFFKYGIIPKYNSFLDLISYIFNISHDDIFANIKNILFSDKNGSIFVSLKKGEIKTKYKTVSDYFNFITTELYRGHEDIEDILSIPGVILNNKKLEFVIFDRINKIESDDISILHNDPDDIYKLEKKNCNYILIIKENLLYNPIVMMTKEKNKNYILTKFFNYEPDKKNIIYHISPYHRESCNNFMQISIPKLSVKQISHIINIQNLNYNIHRQYIDSTNKCTFVVLNELKTKKFFIIPTKPSGALYNVKITENLEKYYKNFDDTLEYLYFLYNKSKKEFFINPIGFCYDKIIHDEYNVVSIITMTHDYVPIIPKLIKKTDIDKNMNLEKQPLYSTLDEYIKKNNFGNIDGENILNFSLYIENGYLIFKYHLSDFINNNDELKKNMSNTLNDNKLTQQQKIHIISIIIYNIISQNLLQKYIKLNDVDKNLTNVTKFNNNAQFVNIQTNNDDINISNLKFNPILNKCDDFDKNTCEKNIMCALVENKCKLSIPIKLVILFTNKFISELINNDYKTKEILNSDGYKLSDIVDETHFVEKINEKIILIEPHKNSMDIIKNIFQTMDKFIHKKDLKNKKNQKNLKNIINMYNRENIENPLKKLASHYIQKVNMENGIFNGYANSYYWLKHKYYDIKNRNLGFVSITQINIANYIKGEVIKWLLNKNNMNDVFYILNYDKKNTFTIDKLDYAIQQYILLIHNPIEITNGIVELYILNKLFNIYKIYVYNDEQIMYVFDNNIVYDIYKKNTTKININNTHDDNNDIPNDHNAICLKFNLKLNDKKYTSPNDIFVICYK